MKNIKAFLVALALFVVTLGGMHLLMNRSLPTEGIKYATWTDYAKNSCTQALQKLASNPDSMLVFGSSELKHGIESGFHGDTIFDGTDMQPVFIGRAGYQCLTHTITLAALKDGTANQKVVLIVSPQWFKKDGVSSNAFETTFSEDNFIAMLENPSLSEETRDYIINRTQQIVSDNDVMAERIGRDITWYNVNEPDKAGGLLADAHKAFIEEKSRYALTCKALVTGQWQKTEPITARSLGDNDWQQLYRQAGEQGKTLCGNNSYGMYDKAYKNTYAPLMKAGKHKNPKYNTDSMEFDDLECFLKVCKDEGIKPMLVILPFNGYWYDYSGLTQEKRQAFYEKTKSLAIEYGATCADMSAEEYATCFFEDNSHPALKGLVEMNEKIYEFYRAD